MDIVRVFVCCAIVFAVIGAAAQSPEEIARVEGAVPAEAPATPGAPRKLLVFTLCKGFVHSSIPLGAKSLELMGQKTGAYTAVVSDDPNMLAPDRLNEFDAVCMLNTTGELFDDPNLRQSFLRFVKSGKGLVGIHAATDCFYQWSDYGEMMGGYFDGHPWGAGDTVAIKLDDPAHPLNRPFLGRGFSIKDEIYQFKPEPYTREKLRVLISLNPQGTDMTKRGIKRTDGDFAVAWCRQYGEGRVFYCSLGHNESTYWNPSVLAHYLAGIQFALGDLKADATPSAQLPPDYLARSALELEERLLDDLFKLAAVYTYGADPAALEAIADRVISSHASPAQRAELEKRLIELIGTNATPDAIQFACKQLYLIATEASIPALTTLLSNENTVDAARYVLERMPSATAGDVLRQAFSVSTGVARSGLVNSLGERREPESVPLLAPLIRDPDPVVADAAAQALGKIGGADATKALLTALNTSDEDRYPQLLSAVLVAAETGIEHGDHDTARSVYENVLRGGNPRLARVAGLRGIAALDGTQSVPLLIEAFNEPNPDMRTAAALAIRELTDESAVQSLIAQLSGLPPASQQLLIEAFADRGEQAAMGAVLSSVQSPDAQVVLSAVKALAAIGDASAVPVLAAVAANTEGDLQQAARRSLARLRGDDVDRALIAGLSDAAAGVRAELVRALGERRTEEALPVLLNAAADSDENVRTQAFASLARLAGPEQLQPLVGLVAAEQNDMARTEGEQALTAAVGRGGDPAQNAAVLLSALPDVKQGIPAYCSLLRVLGRVQAPESLSALIAAAKVKNPEVKSTAVRAIAEWPSPEPAEELLALANAEEEAAVRDVALRGYLRMIELPQSRETKDTIRLYEQAMKTAASAEERKLVLASAGNQRDAGLLEFVAPYLEDTEVQAEARAAHEKLQNIARSPSASHNPAEAPYAVDGNPATRWTTGEPKNDGMWFAVDLGWEMNIGRVILDSSGSPGDFPQGYEIFLSKDGKEWGKAAAAGENTSDVLDIAFAPRKARHLKIVQVGKSEGNWWSIHELRVESK